ncbi:multiple inositol polyphosphate phosphatase 1-like [Hyposmocoma kahamanoa]|uniref:multiple inositol polyphosphate phosphatase 1-like n=1 Tax=Hyposmocoma kahamanoa TaxID=1477025 RepID=UPI000E6D7EF5|nr:multiple inositol polyphosphate phosphatase 1-like [Hyposmocoma kahamanoa]
MGWSLLTLLLLVTTASAQREICLSGDDNPYLLFGTKTAYIFANRGVPNLKAHDVPGCTPIALWLVNRHGSHNPEANEIALLQSLSNVRKNIIDNYRRGEYRNFNERICSSDLNLLQQWSWNPRHNITYAGDLTSDGYTTTQHLAQAFRQKFPGLLTNNRHDYMFKLADDKLSNKSLGAFMEGLFRTQADDLDVLKEVDDKLLRPYKACSGWESAVEQNNETYSQKYIFESKREFKEMITNISQRLGFNYDMSLEVAQRMYQICRYNKAWDVSQISPWCAAFTRQDLKRFEYSEDLESYYKFGYGSPTNRKLGCPLVKELVDFFTKHVENDPPQQPRALVHFTDAPSILMTIVAMGTHRDSAPLTGDNYHTNMVQSRKWSTSNMSPFNANLAAALYKCTPNGKFQYNEMYQVLFLENEKTMNMDGCKVGLCDWSYVKNRFAEVISQCNTESCNAAASLSSLVSLIVVTLVIVQL